MGDVLERAVFLVQEELSGAVLISHEQVQPPVVVDVGPDGGLRARRRPRHTAGDGDVGEGPVAVVAQQRLALRQLPSATQHQDVETAVVVVVGLQDVQPAELVTQPGLRRPLGEAPIRIVVKKVHGRAAVEARRHDVEPSVVVEIVDDQASRRREGLQPGPRSHVDETPHIFC